MDCAQVNKVVCAVAQEIGCFTEFDDTGLDEIVLGIPQLVDSLGAKPVPQDGRARDEVALPILFQVAGVPGVRGRAPLLDVVAAAHALTQLCGCDAAARVSDLVGTRGGGAA